MHSAIIAQEQNWKQPYFQDKHSYGDTTIHCARQSKKAYLHSPLQDK